MKKGIFFSILFSLLGATAFCCPPARHMTITPHKYKLQPLFPPSKIIKKRSHIHSSLPLIRNKGLSYSSSSNWSGYASLTNLAHPQTNSVTAVSGSWTVPKIFASKSKYTYSAIWVGIDGYSSNSVEQIGTEQEWSGKQSNYAWFEMYPSGAYMLTNFPIQAGDVINTSITSLGGNQFRLFINNSTKRKSATITATAPKNTSALRTSAEWVVEAPSSGNKILPLAKFSPITLTNCSAIINGKTGSINASNRQYDKIIMQKGKNGAVESTPSGLSNNGTSFTVTWSNE